MKDRSIADPATPSLSLSRVILYVKDIEKVASFYEVFFGMRRVDSEETGWLELESSSGGCEIALHQASKSQKPGTAVKIVFGVKDVQAFIDAVAVRGLKFGPLHIVRRAPGHEYANVKDPAGNSVSVSRPRASKSGNGVISRTRRPLDRRQSHRRSASRESGRSR